MNYTRLPLRWLSVATLLLLATFARAQSGQLEYWFDDYSNVRTASLSGTTSKIGLNTDGLSQGFHRLCMRVKQSGNKYSPIYTSTFLKFPSAESSELEYWFDDDYEKKASVPINAEASTLQKLVLDMANIANFPLGFHRLNMRIAAGAYSPVYTAPVMRLPDGQHSQLTYWLNDDYANRRVVKGNAVNNVTTDIASSLDFSSVPSGMHRLKYRITANGFDHGVIYEVPILVTRLYNNQPDVTIVRQTNWVDEFIKISSDFVYPRSVATPTYTLNPKDYEVGQHAFHVQFRNSAGVWTEVNTTYFYKKEPSGPLYAGRMPADLTGIDEGTVSDYFNCTYRDGTLLVECQSPKLASTGILIVSDQTGKIITRQNVNASNGIRAEVNVNNAIRQLVIIRVLSGDLNMSRKIIIQ